MNLPNWLTAMTGAGSFANNPANNFQPTVGDAFQGIGHSMMEHFRAGQAAPNPAAAGQPVPPMAPPQQMAGFNPGAAMIPPGGTRQAPQVQQFIPPDIAKLVAQQSGAPLVGVPTPLAGTGSPISEIMKLFSR